MRKWLWLLLLLTTRVSAVEISPYIVNGTNANVANYPSFASLAIYISPSIQLRNLLWCDGSEFTLYLDGSTLYLWQ